MPARLHPEERMTAEIDEEIDRMAEALALEEGPAAGADEVSADEALDQWGQGDPRIGDPEGLKQQLMTTGLPPEMMDLNNEAGLAIFKVNPALAEMYAQPADEQLADMLTRLAERPFRLSLLEPYEDDPEEAVKVAKGYDRRWQKRASQDAWSTASRSQMPEMDMDV